MPFRASFYGFKIPTPNVFIQDTSKITRYGPNLTIPSCNSISTLDKNIRTKDIETENIGNVTPFTTMLPKTIM